MRIKRHKSHHLVYFVLHPFLTLIYYLANFKKPQAKNVMWLFTIFYGAVFAIGAESQGSDINRYIDEILRLNQMSLNLNGALQYFYLSGEVDILRTVLAVLVSYFTDNGYYLIVVFGVIFGYFYSRNMWYVLDRLEGKTKSFTRILIFCLFLIVPIWFINGFRFWTATHVFLFGLMPYLFEGKKKSLIWCFLTPFLIHYSFLFAIAPLSIYLLLGNRIKYYFILFIVTFFISNIDINQFNNLISKYVPNALIERSDSYRSEEKVAEFRNSEDTDTKVWYAKYYIYTFNYVSLIFLIYLYLVNKQELLKRSNRAYLRLLGFIFLYTSFANLISTIPSGGRFLYLSKLLTIIFIMLMVQNYPASKTLRKLSYFSTPFLIFFLIVTVRISFYSVSIMTIFGNPISAIFTFGDNLALNDILKGF
jgi:hypothetical protein